MSLHTEQARGPPPTCHLSQWRPWSRGALLISTDLMEALGQSRQNAPFSLGCSQSCSGDPTVGVSEIPPGSPVPPGQLLGFSELPGATLVLVAEPWATRCQTPGSGARSLGMAGSGPQRPSPGMPRGYVLGSVRLLLWVWARLRVSRQTRISSHGSVPHRLLRLCLYFAQWCVRVSGLRSEYG